MKHEKRRRGIGFLPRAALPALVLAALPASADSPTPAPLGAEFQINTLTSGDQARPVVAADPDGNFVVVWDTFNGSNIQARRYAADGTALGGEITVNSSTASHVRPSVAMADDGNFVVVWASNIWPLPWVTVEGRRFAANGSPLGSQFQVNTVQMGPADYQLYPSVAAAADGSFVVVWQSTFGIQGRRYGSDGSAVGAQFQINTYATGGQNTLAVAAAPNGDFVVVWTSSGSPGTDTSGSSVQGRRYASDGSALGDQFQINTFTTGTQSVGGVAATANGDFIVAWTSDGSPGDDTSFLSVQAQLYASDGTPQGAQFQVNTSAEGFQTAPAVSTAADGGFVIVWFGGGGNPSAPGVYGQRFAANGSPRGTEFQVNSSTFPNQWDPDVAVADDGDFVAVWQSGGSSGTDASGSSIQGRRFSLSGPVAVPALGQAATLALVASLMALAIGALRRRA